MSRPRAIILAAGLGTRLGALSDERPKPLLPVCDVPLIRYAAALLHGHGIHEIAVNLHHHGDQIRAELGPGFRYSEEPVILGTGGGLRRLGDWLSDGGRAPFVVVNGKLLIDVDLDAVLARHRERDASATMVLRETADAARWGAIGVGDDGRVRSIVGVGAPDSDGVPLSQCMFTGVHVISPRLLARLPEGVSDSIRQGYQPALAAGERIEGVINRGYFHEHSTPARYLEGNWNALDGRAALRFPPGPLSGVDPSARVAGTVVGPVRVGAGASIARGAVVGPYAVVGRGSRVDGGARLERVVVWPDCCVDAPLQDAIVTARGPVRVDG